jgi:prolipoprotein diacylglyceryltransferase
MWFPGPVLFNIGPIPINTLGFAVGLAVLVGLWVLPMPLFEAIGDLIILGILLWIKNKKTFNGMLFLLMLSLYSASRFIMEFWRGDSLLTIFDLKVAQLTALVTIVIAVSFWVARFRQAKMQVKHELAKK